MTAHKHAALMLQYAQDAAETDTPWERWQTCESETLRSGAWEDDWEDLTANPDWRTDAKYRRKPQTIKVGRHEFPRPISHSLKDGDRYYRLLFSDKGFIPECYTWDGDPVDELYVASRTCHLTMEAALAHADALNAICWGDVE